MKKLLLLTLILCLILPINAYASSNTDLETLLEQQDNVAQAKVFVYENTAIVALHTVGIVSRTSYNELVERVTEQVLASDSNLTNCIVTRNIKLYRAIEKINSLDGEQKQQLIDKVIDKVSQMPRPLEIEPQH